MANLSNINGKFVVEQTTGYVGVGTTDPNYPIEVLNASAEIALNASGGSIYRVQSDSASNFIIRKAGVGDRLIISSAGNATFAGDAYVTGTSNSNVVISRDNMYVDAGQLYIGADDATTDDTFRQRVTSGSYFIESRKSGTWTNRLQINSAGTLIAGQGATFAGSISATSTSNTLTLYNNANNDAFRVFRGSLQTLSLWTATNGTILSLSSDTVAGSITLDSRANQDSYINTGGNVGIGLTSPAARLDVLQETRISYLQGNQYRTRITNTDGNTRILSDGQQCNIIFGTTGNVANGTASEAMRLNWEGKLGIGTTLPGSKLHVVDGNNYAKLGDLHGNSTMSLRMADNSGFPVEVQAYGTELRFNTATTTGATPSVKMNILPNGNVGIGTTSPSAPLTVHGQQKWYTTNSDGNELRGFFNPGGSGDPAELSLYQANASTVGVELRATGNSYFNGGNVGIGVTGPLSPLSIQANSGGSALRLIGRSDGISGIDFFNSTQTVGNYFQSNGTWIRLRADGGFHFSKGSTPITTDVDGFTIEGMNVGIGTASPDGTLHVVGKVNTNRIVSGNLIAGNIRSNLTTTTYLLLVDLNVSAGFSLVGELNAASYTTYNVSRIYIRKNYNATTGAAVITGIAKSGSNLSVVDISHSSGRFIAIKLTGDPEIDVMWTGYRLNDQFNSDGTIKILTSGVTENSVYASY